MVTEHRTAMMIARRQSLCGGNVPVMHNNGDGQCSKLDVFWQQNNIDKTASPSNCSYVFPKWTQIKIAFQIATTNVLWMPRRPKQARAASVLLTIAQLKTVLLIAMMMQGGHNDRTRQVQLQHSEK